jgi:tetratricopeptide (TPR) repeat protein
MQTRRTLPALVAAALAITGLVSSPAPAQQLDLSALVTNSLTAMNNFKWQEALDLLTQATDRFGKNAKVLFGSKFGVLWYRRGLCELRLNKYAEAMKSFETCYRDFPNQGANAQGGGNPYHKKSLLKWGEAAQGAEDYQQAIRMYKKFLDERDKARDKFPQGAFYVNMAICHFKLAKIPEGIENLEIAIKNKETFPTPDAGIVAGFQALVAAVIDKRNEQALLDFMEKNRAEIIIEPFEMPPYASLFMKLAGDAVSADMDRAAMALYQLVPGTEVVRQDLQARLEMLGERPGVRDGGRNIVNKDLKDQIAEIDKYKREGTVAEATALGAMAFMHEKHGNIRAAYAAFEQLELYWSEKNKKREDNLYNLVRTSSLVGEVLATEEHGSRFLKLFPESKHVPAVRRMMLTSLFYEGEYVKCIEVASVMEPKLPKGSKEHDICLHVLGGSYYYTGKYDEAQPLLNRHVEEYPKSQFEQAALYFQASNNSRLQFWGLAAKQLDAFFEKFPDPGKNVFFPFALYDRANCHYAEEENDPALEKLNRLEKEFPNAEVMEMAYNLKGNVLQTKGEKEPAETYYKKALELAEHRENRPVAAESLNYLVALLGEKPKGKEENPRLKDAVPYADKFWKEHADSPFKTQVAVTQVYALDSVGRGEEALSRLRDVIAEIASDPNAPGLEEAINSYKEVYLEKHTPDELKEHFYAFPKIRASDKAARALLRIAIIGVFEEVGKKSKDEDQKRKAEAMITVLFRELKGDFDPKDLSNYILVRLGDYLRTRTSGPRQALPYYDEALGRTDQSYRFPALFGRADVYASGSGEELTKAETDLKRVFADSTDKNDRERALYRLIQVEMQKSDFAGAEANARLYLDKKQNNFSKWAAEVSLLLAQTYDKRGMINDALSMYTKVWGAYMGYIAVSGPAMKRWMELSWDRGLRASSDAGISDRQGAYEAGWTYIDSTKRFFDKMTEPEQEFWKEVQKLVLDFEARPEVKSMDKVKAEKEAARGRR